MSLLTSPTRSRHRFPALQVVAPERLPDDATAGTFAIPDELADEFLSFRPGQHLTLRATIDGEDVRQTYSICLSRRAALASRTLRVASARVPGGRMSNWINDRLQAGDAVQVMPPLGSFVCPVDPAGARHHVAIAAGSGITPVLSLVTTVLEEEPASRVTLFFGNQRTSTVMFLEELEDLKNRYLDRFQLVHVLSREPQGSELFSGRLDSERLPRLLAALAPISGVDQWYLCGPAGMVETAQKVLADAGVESHHVHHEVFHVPSQEAPRPRVLVKAGAPPEAVVIVNLDGRTSRIEMPSREETILDATLRVRADAPFSCTGGVCGTCRARLVEG